MENLEIALITSGKGTMLRHVLEASSRHLFPGRVVAVASNVECPALAVARSASVPNVACFKSEAYPSRHERDGAMGQSLIAAGANFALIAGYTERLSSNFLELFPDRAISPYPSALPAFGELDEAIGPALDYGVKLLIMTWHYHAPESLSNGAIIAQEGVPVTADDTIETVMQPLVEMELQMLWKILSAFAAGAIQREGRKVRFTPG